MSSIYKKYLEIIIKLDKTKIVIFFQLFRFVKYAQKKQVKL